MAHGLVFQLPFYADLDAKTVSRDFSQFSRTAASHKLALRRLGFHPKGYPKSS